MDSFLVAGRQNPSGFLALHFLNVKLERQGLRSHSNALKQRVSSYDWENNSRFLGHSIKSRSGEKNTGLDSSGWCKGQRVDCLGTMYSLPLNTVARGERSLRRMEMRSSKGHSQPINCSCGNGLQDSVCLLCSTSVEKSFGSSFQTFRRVKSHLDHHVTKYITNFRTSTTSTRHRLKSSLYSMKTSSVRPNIYSHRKQQFIKMTGVMTRKVDALSFSSHKRKRRVPCVCHAENGASGSPIDLPPQGDESTSKGEGSSTSPFQRMLSYLKQVDWMHLVFKWEKKEPLWNVPWTGQTIFQVMVLWFAAFWVMGSWIIPIAAQLAGFSRHSLSFRGQALYSLVTDIAEGTVGIWILKRCLARFLPLPEGWFPINFKGNWMLEACWGCLLFPLVNKLSQLNLFLLPLPSPLTTSYVEQSMMSRDPVATLLYAVVISVCAPVWEEVIFRGFLLPSMTRYLPLWGAISVSALAFALAHFSMQRILPLTFLGLVMGFVFVRSRNLMASIVLHSLWNGFAFLELL